MPKIPTYDPRLPMPSPSGLGVNAGAMIAAAGQPWDTLAQAGIAMSADEREREDRRQRERDAIAVMRADAAFGDAERSFLTDAYNRKELDADGITEAGKTWYAENAPKFSATLQNERQRLMFEERAFRRRDTGLDTVARHENQQWWAGKARVLEGVVQQAEQDAAVFAADDGRFKEIFTRAITSVRDTMPGMDTRAKELAISSGLMTARILGLKQSDPDRAMQILDSPEAANLLDPKTRASLQETMKARAEEVKVEKGYAAVTSMFKGDERQAIAYLQQPTNAATLGLSHEQARKIMGDLKQDYSFRKAEEEEGRRNYRNAAYTKFLTAFSQPGSDLGALKAAVLSSPMEASDKGHWITMLESEARYRQGKGDEAKERVAGASFLTRLYADEIKDVPQLVREYGGLVSASTLRTMESNWSQRQKEKEQAGPNKYINYFEEAQKVAKEAIKQAYPEAERERRLAEFSTTLDYHMRQNKWTAQHPEVMEQTKKLLAPLVEPTSLFGIDWLKADDTRLSFEAFPAGPPTPGQAVPTIPLQTRQEIIRRLEKDSQPASEENIRRMYIRFYQTGF